MPVWGVDGVVCAIGVDGAFEGVENFMTEADMVTPQNFLLHRCFVSSFLSTALRTGPLIDVAMGLSVDTLTLGGESRQIPCNSVDWASLWGV